MGLNKDKVSAIKNAFENRCYQLIIDAYKKTKVIKAINLDWNENDITSELHKHIISNTLRTKWRISTNVEHHLPKDYIEKVKGYSAKYPRIDLRLTSFNSLSEYEYFFEAKNLKENDSALKRRYIDTGINNYISKKYENGSLVGYLIEGNSDLTIKGINSLLKKDKRNTEVLQLKFLKLHKDYYESEHKDIGILKHLIFEFANN